MNSLTAHPEDSTALAEHICPQDIEQRLEQFKTCNTPAKLLTRAWLRYELALATPGNQNDDELFSQGREDLERALGEFSLPKRSRTRIDSQRLLHYEPAFRERSRQPGSLYVPSDVVQELQTNSANTTLDFLDGPDLTNDDCGILSEQVAIDVLLDTELFPYIASQREEGNLFPGDNHDIYALYPNGGNGLRKAPASIKFRAVVPSNPYVFGCRMGPITRKAILTSPYYRGRRSLEKYSPNASLRLVADIAICQALGDELSHEDTTVLTGVQSLLRELANNFIDTTDPPDYAANAIALSVEQARIAALNARPEPTCAR